MKMYARLAFLFLGAFSLCIEAKITNLRFFGLWFGTGRDIILKFESTLVVPGPSPDAPGGTRVQAVWPGVQGKGLLQNVITIGDKKGEWWQLPYYCCNPGKDLAAEVQVYPGDSITNTFILNEATMEWQDNYAVTPGASAQEPATDNTTTSSFIFDQAAVVDDDSTVGDHFTWTFMTIELQGDGKWDFGPVAWRDILLGPVLNGGTKFNYTFSKPTASAVGIML
ncbi:uncharacterized protein LY89DRAFT_662631 [Mollisia scopiformis]|uniref:Uncharacterized protein n=1 Tax=Mollisia scopiformis TaxID=149040 RepID=A0A194XUM2_MOLSC|nr:uncharacterized protein LY89DRAFT_662631 [Mollisia scopiformis]KUJ23836.1 hypothetical protein LY89DRAFT_662631 [Mollisia scopiformis]